MPELVSVKNTNAASTMIGWKGAGHVLAPFPPPFFFFSFGACRWIKKGAKP